MPKTTIASRPCSQCGKIYKPVSNKANQEFCSRDCLKKAHISTSVCLNCGEKFQYKSWKERKYCSNPCVAQHTAPLRSQRKECTCIYCGEIFSAPQGNNPKYCSIKCVRLEAAGKKEIRNCLQCGIAFEAYIKQDPKFCSHTCYAKSMENKDRRACQQCGTIFECKPCEKTIYCSQPCCADAMKCEGSHAGYGPEWTSIRYAIRERDGFRCVACGIIETTRSHDVHHITPLRNFNGDLIAAHDPNNLVTLCKTCHGLAESGKIALD